MRALFVCSFLVSAAAQSFDTFESKVRPVLAQQCFGCHGPKLQSPMAGLRVDSREGLLKGGDHGPAIVPGSPAGSRLIQAVKGQTIQMPPTARLQPEQIAALEKWIAEGAPWPKESTPSPQVSEAKRTDHWAFRPITRQTGPIEAHVAKLSPEADPRTLLRRLSFDLTGLPPDTGANASYAETVDRLLQSPHFGERWARYWLDLARFSDAGFNNIRFPYSHAYRDWLIGAINQDMPFPEFVHQQLAADRIPGNARGNLAALGFLAIGFDPHRPNGIPEKIDDRIDVVTRGFLGLTVACARCHDHKYDPIPTADYYGLYGVFLNTADDVEPPALQTATTPLDSFFLPRISHRLRQLQDFKRERIQALREDARRPEMLAKYIDAAREGKEFTGPQLENLAKERNLELYILKRFRDGHPDPASVPLEDFAYVQTEGDYNTSNNLLWEYKRVLQDYAVRGGAPRALAVSEAAEKKPTYILTRGNWNDPGAQVEPHFPAVLGGGPLSEGSGRLELARRITATDLAFKVFVNRVWQRLFGEGIVRSPSDFGLRGDPPTHPELLDYLAGRFKQHGSLKTLIREIVMSKVYRQSSAATPDDPENRQLARQSRRRLDFEALRDSILAASGALEAKVGGPSFSLSSIPAGPRRTLYAFVERERAQALLKAFNYADPEQHTPQRYLTTIPQQALFLLNSPFLAEQAGRLSGESIDGLYRRILGRPPSISERKTATGFLQSYRPAAAARAESSWQYGTAAIDPEGTRVLAFTPFRYFNDGVWQHASLLPDAASGSASLAAGGGAPGDGYAHAVARRWTAPASTRIRISGTLTLPLDQFEIRFGFTNGIRGTIVSSRHGRLGQWELVPPENAATKEGSRKAVTDIAEIEVQPGDTIDFIVDSRNDYESDNFTWSPVITGDGSRRWSAATDFRGPEIPTLNATAALAQVLFLTNEFAHID
ncbi:MAG: DUF1553 domain-containing protein [Acidobacteria bacterium]|nr:DUF1553 domain-containing protein [Acidobacteriota bacterium]